MMRTSVIVPARDAQRTLGLCLDAILGDLPPDTEVIVVDDASEDGSAEVARRHPVRLVRHEKPRGPSAARNSGLAAALGEVLVFVDADVTLRRGTLGRLLEALRAEPALQGCNGIFALDPVAGGLVTAFVNTSIHFQHLRHGPRVPSAFTAVCALRRAALERMGGWDEGRESRYGDDVHTRWHLAGDAIALVPAARAEHHKTVRLGGLLKHRFNIGHHFVRSVGANASAARRRPGVITLHRRYPINTLLAMGLLLCWPAPPLSALLLLAAAANNAGMTRFTLHHRGRLEAALVLPLSLLEGAGFGLGIISGACHVIRG